MSYVLFVVGFLRILYYKHLLDRTGNKKEVPKKLLLPPLICFILCIVGVMLYAYT